MPDLVVSVLVSFAIMGSDPGATAPGDAAIDAPSDGDWLVDRLRRPARVRQPAGEIVLENGLVRRSWRIAPNAACVGFDDLMTGQSLLRSVRPEARVRIDGVEYDVGGLVGQPNHAFLRPGWSLPRDEQVIHTRQNIYDGTWMKTPSMGWMFVPLTEYHGGGAGATIEPLDAHLDHYERMLRSNLALGVQACYRGPRLYDTDRTRDVVKGWVDWYKTYRDILESDIVHGRRADGRDVDWMLHVNPDLQRRGMLVVFNPLDEAVTRTIRVDLTYAGLADRVTIRPSGGDARETRLSREGKVELEVDVPARGMAWYVIER